MVELDLSECHSECHSEGWGSFLHTLRGFPLLEVVPCGTIEDPVLAF